MQMRRLAAAAALTVAMAAGACGSVSPSGGGGPKPVSASAVSTGGASNLPAAVRALLPKARAEGQVLMFVGTFRYTTAQQAMLTQAFQKVFGIHVDVKTVSLGPHTAALARLKQEIDSGVPPSVDVFITSAAIIAPALREGVVQPVNWTKLGIARKNLTPDYHFPYIWDNLRTLFYNTDLVKRADAPHKWTDLLNPRWKGKIVAPGFASGFSYFQLLLGRKQALSEVRQLVVQQHISLSQTYTDQITKVANGEFAIGYGPSIEDELRKGAHLAYAPLNHSVALPQGLFLVKGDRHPAASELLAYLLAQTPAGEQALWKGLSWAKSTTPGTDAAAVLGHGKGIFQTEKWVKQVQPGVTLAMSKILGLPNR